MIRSPLDNNVSLVHCLLGTVIQDEIDGSLQDYPEVNTLSPMHDVDTVFGIARWRKVDNAAVNSSGAY